MLQRPEQRPVDVGAVAGGLQIGAQPCRSLRVDRQRVAPSALAHDAQRVIAAVLVQIADLERGDLGAAQPDLQADRQDRAVAQPGDRVLGRQVEHLARLRLREGEGRAFVAIDRRPLDLGDRVLRGMAVPHQVLVERRQRREPAADRRRCGVLDLAHVALPGDHRFVVGLAQLVGRGDASVRMKCCTSSR